MAALLKVSETTDARDTAYSESKHIAGDMTIAMLVTRISKQFGT